MWSVGVLFLAAASASADAGSATAPKSAPAPHLCVRRFGGSRASKARPAYITVGYGGRPQQEIGAVNSKELRCFELAGGTFTVQVQSNGAATASAPGMAPELCGDRIEVSGMRTGWLEVSLVGQPVPPAGCPWTITSKRGQGPLPVLPPRPDGMVEKDFIVLPAIASYAEARRVAGTAARGLGLKLDLRRARPDGRGGLTFSRADCKANEWGYPCYVARGRDDDGGYVSVDEASRFFDAEAEGYLVVLGSAPKDDPSLRALAAKARSLFPTAEIRTDDVWEGCIH